MVVYTDSNNPKPISGFDLDCKFNSNLKSAKNRVKNSFGINKNVNITSLSTNNNNSNSNGPNATAKKHSIFINALNFGKHFTAATKKKTEKKQNQQKENIYLKNVAPLESSKSFQEKSRNISKSLSCYNLKSGTTTNNIEVVKNLNREIQLSNEKCDENHFCEDKENRKLSNKPDVVPTISITRPLGPPVPPKPTILLSKNSVRPSYTRYFPPHPTTFRNSITLTSNEVDNSNNCSSKSNLKKTVIQVSRKIMAHLRRNFFELFKNGP